MNLHLVNNQFNPDLLLTNSIYIDSVTASTMQYFDKDGYELNDTEQLYYQAHGVNIHEQHLNHVSNQVTWFADTDNSQLGATLDHSMLVQRWAYTDQAREQIRHLAEEMPLLNKLLSIKPKWGFDVSMDLVYPGGATELFHVEFDSFEYDHACEQRDLLAELVSTTDWEWGGRQVLAHRDQWEHLSSDDQSDWKVQYFGWHRAFDNRKILD